MGGLEKHHNCLVGVLVALAALVPYATAQYKAGGLDDSYWGVYGEIYTIGPTIPTEHHFKERVLITLSDESFIGAVEIGYYNGSYTDYELLFFTAKLDKANGLIVFFSPGPAPGSWHRYQIVNTQKWPPKEYAFYIDGVEVWRVNVDPYTPKSEQALEASIATSTSAINIDGTHFRSLRYFDGRSWPYWATFSEFETPPYWVDSVTTYEFYAGGGG